MKALLDTPILLFWFSSEEKLTAEQQRIIAGASAENPLYVSDISLWEVAALYDLGRITLNMPLRDWLERSTAPPLVHLIGISPAIAAETAGFTGSFHRNPADRIIVGTAKVMGATLLTNDKRIQESGLVATA